jgi:hypothetical protein
MELSAKKYIEVFLDLMKSQNFEVSFNASIC